jgi:hypothetical protein
MSAGLPWMSRSSWADSSSRAGQGRAGDASPSVSVGGVVAAVDAQSGAVVLGHAVDYRGLVERRPEVGVVAFAHMGRSGGAVPGVGVRADDTFGRLFGLAEEPPVPPRSSEPGVGPSEMLDDRQPIHDGQVRHGLGVVHRGTERDQSSTVVPGDGEPVVAELRHERENVIGHRTLGRLRMIGLVRWESRLAVPAQVGRHDNVVLGEPGRDCMPGRVCARVTVQQHDGRSGTAVSDPQRHVTDVHLVQNESLEHRPNITELAMPLGVRLDPAFQAGHAGSIPDPETLSRAQGRQLTTPTANAAEGLPCL